MLSTVTGAADRDYRLYFLSDRVTDPDPRAHRTLMTGALPRPAHIVDTAGLRSLLYENGLVPPGAGESVAPFGGK